MNKFTAFNRQFSSYALTFFVAFSAIIGCTKIETTTMGGDLVPAVDYVHTFDSLITVISNNYIPADSTRISAGSDHVAGGIYNDPQFGTCKSTLFFEMKPSSYPYKFSDSTVYFDSAVLVLRFSTYYGDSSFPVQFNLYEVDRKMAPDTSLSFLPSYTINPALEVNRSKFWGSKTIRANQYRDTVFIKRGDSVYARVNGQLRIPLDESLALALFKGDSATVYGSDSIFKSYLPGFALEPQGNPMALHYFSLAQGGGSEIQFFFRSKKGTIQDTLARAYGLTSASGHAVKFERNRAGAELNNYLTTDPVNGVEQIYLDGTPGVMASIKIPDIKILSNRVLHRVELQVTELDPPNGTLSQMYSPRALYLDAESENEPGIFRGLPYDLNPFSNYYCYPGSGIDFGYYGGVPKPVTIDGVLHTRYTFNITRYVQSVITRGEPFFNFRLSAPYYMYYRDCASQASTYPANIFPFTSGTGFINDIGESRVRLGGGNHPDPRYRIKLRIIYSKL